MGMLKITLISSREKQVLIGNELKEQELQLINELEAPEI